MSHFKTFSKASFLILVLCLALVGCRGGKSMYVVNNAAAPYTSTKMNDKQALERMRKAIKIATSERGWVAEDVNSGLIVATLTKKDSMAKIEIPYTAKNFSINYADSRGLGYDASARTIHNGYNGWVMRLEQDIKTQLARD